MEPAALQAVCQQVYARFPNLREVQPKVERQRQTENVDPALSRYLLVFKTHLAAANGRTMLFVVRVTADAQGKILKLTTSR